jgi:5'-3' exonuclease
VDKTIEVYAPVKKKTFTKDNIFEELKVLPENYNVVKALTGDNSDNLAGVKGLGIKTIVSEFPNLLKDPTCDLQYIYDTCAAKLKEKKVKKIFPKIITEWDRVETNFQLMDLNVSDLDEKEKEFVNEVIKSPINDLQTGAFLHLLDQDKIEGITKNTEGWLDNFKGLRFAK